MKTLKIAYHPNPRLQPLMDGTVKLEGFKIDWTIANAADMHGRHLNENAFDVFEFSISNLLITKDMPERAHLRWKAIPMHLMRCDFFYDLHVRRDSGIRSFADLKGKKLGMPDYQMTAAVWLRIMLGKLYGIRPQDISWVNGRNRAHTHGAGVAENLAPGIHLRRLTEGETLNDALHKGEIDAALGDAISCRLTAGGEVERLPMTVAKQMCSELTAKTGLRPVNHALLIQEDLVAQHPELPMLLYEACEKSKIEAYARAPDSAASLMIFPELYFADNAAAFGEDPYPSGFRTNRHVVEAIRDELLLEQLTRKKIEVDSLFVPSTLGT